jgi:type IV pilus assembly protein PilM
VLDAIAEALPISDGLQRGEVPDPTQIPYNKQKELHIVRIESKYFEQIEQWFTPEVKSQYERGLDPKANKTAEAQPSDDGSQPPEPDPTATDSFASESTEQTGPTGPGWVVEISGYHFYYDADSMSTTGTAHVRNSFMRSLSEGTVTVLGPDMKPMQFTTEELGIEYVTLVDDGGIDREHMMPNPNYKKSEAGSSSSSTQQERIRVPRNVFTVQFCWREKPLTMRLKEREEKRKQQADQMAQSTAAITTSDTGAAGGN